MLASAIPLTHAAIWGSSHDAFLTHDGSIPINSFFIVFAIVIAIFAISGLIMLKKSIIIAPPGTAIIRNGLGGTQVGFSKMICVPYIHQATLIDITAKIIEINREGAGGLVCKDHLRLDVRAELRIRINATPHDVLMVAQALGSKRLSDPEQIAALFEPKFAESLKTIAYRSTLKEIVEDRERFSQDVLEQIGADLNGYVLDDITFAYLEQTPLSDMNPDNILDAEGIRKIYTELDAARSREVHDITFPISDQLTVWPDDTPVSLRHTREVGQGSRATVSRVVLSSHAGTHLDAPSHFLEDGAHVDEIDLTTLIGPCEVVQTDADAITYDVLEGLGIPEGVTRLLLKTRNSTRFSGSEPFFSDYVGVTVGGAKWLLERKIRLVGIDYMSIPAYPEIKAVHHALLSVGMVLLETLDLRRVTPGAFRLIALPLPLAETDGSPVRAVLLSMT